MGCTYSRRRCSLLSITVSLPRSGRVLDVHLAQPVYSCASVVGLMLSSRQFGIYRQGPKARKLAPRCWNLCAAQPPAASGQIRRSGGATSFPLPWGSEGYPWTKRERIWGCLFSLPVLAHMSQEDYQQVGMLGSCPSEVLGCCIHVEDFIVVFMPSSTSWAAMAYSASSFSVGERLARSLNVILRLLQT